MPRAVLQHWPLVLAADGAAGALQVRPRHRAGARLRRRAGRRAAHRPLPGAGRRVRLRAAGAGDRAASCCRPRCRARCSPAWCCRCSLTPLIFMYSNRIVMRLSASDWLLQSVAMTTIAKRSINTEAHVIICGYGRSGQNLARLLEPRSIPYIALDLDPDRVRQAAAAGQSVVFGDAARLQSLMAAGLARASAVVVSYHDTPSALKILHLVQRACAEGAGDRAHDRRQRPRAAARRRRDRGRARGDRGLADAGQPCAGAGRRADAARAAPRAGAARRALRPAARLLPRRRRRHRRGAAAGAPAQRHPAAGRRQPRPDARRRRRCTQHGVTVVSVRRASGAVLAAGRRAACSPPATRWCCRACRSRWRWPRRSCCARG